MFLSNNYTNPCPDMNEPIAIIGIGCRFPGADNPSAFWDLLCSGRDAIREVPADRWNIDRFYSPDPSASGKMYVRKGGFLDARLDQFDAAFFGISPREALQMDPQQRLLLEVAWEAMEDAGVIPTLLAGSDTGVYVGGFMLDSMLLQLSPLNRHNIGTHSATSATMTMLANRLSYCFDFRGPSFSVDTACSSSLVATHLACQGLWRGECSMALAGGVNVMLRPEFPIVMSKGQFLASDGYCKSFDARANGYGRGEGAGVVVLKLYSAALRDGDEIYALIRGTGTNQDGRTDGITVPNRNSQEALIRQVYQRSNVPLNKVRYVEAHGTGTAVGDPIEAAALGNTFGASRSGGDACVIGSVKAAIGHLEAAAGVAGLIKAALCLYHGEIPPQATLETPNRVIPFEVLGLRLPLRRQPVPDNGEGGVYAGVNGFGYGGSNAHVILEQLPHQLETALLPEKTSTDNPPILTLSARRPEALKVLARSYADCLSRADAPPLRDVFYSATNRRAHHEYRLAVIADTPEHIATELLAFAEDGRSERTVTGKLPQHPQDKVVFVFTGMGPQWWAMGRELLEREPIFRHTAEVVDEAFKAVAGWSILAEMRADEEQSNIKQTRIAQPANFLLQAALSELLRSWGVLPAAIVGHSVGEVSAAYVSGALDLQDAVLVSYHRSRLQQTVAGRGKMLATGLGLRDARAVLADCEQLVSVGAINSPGAVTLSGDAATLNEISKELEEKGIFSRFLEVEVPYHSPHMEALKVEMRDVLRDLRPRNPSVRLYSTVTGRLVDGAIHNAEYWCNNIREPVLFADAVSSILAHGYAGFLEVGPHPVLANSIKEAQRHAGTECQIFASLRRGQPEQATISMALAGLHVSGYAVDWRKVIGEEGARYVKLPTYPWQRETFWLESETAAADRIGRPDHPLLGMRVRSPMPTWECDLSQYGLAYLADHVVDNVTVVPAAAYVEQGLAIASLLDETGGGVLENLEFHRALIVSKGKEPTLRSTFDERTREYRIDSASPGDIAKWTLHATGRISPAAPSHIQSVSLTEIRQRCPQRVDANDLYARLAAFGLSYGPEFQRIQGVLRRPGEALAELQVSISEQSPGNAYHLHPTLLDSSLQLLVAVIDENEASDGPFVPVSIKRVSYFGAVHGRCWSHVALTKQEADGIEGNIILCDDNGGVIAELLGVRCQPIASAKADIANLVTQRSYVPTWEIADRPDGAAPPGRWLVLTDGDGIGESAAASLRARGVANVMEIACRDIFRDSGDRRSSTTERDLLRLDRALTEAGECAAIVFLGSLDDADWGDDPTRGSATINLLSLVQALADRSPHPAPRLYVVTRGAQQIVNEPIGGLNQSPVVGLARTVLSEHPDLRCTLIDLDPDAAPRAATDLVDELLSDSAETEIALRGADRCVYRLIPLSQVEGVRDEIEELTLPAAEAGAFRLEVGAAGRIESLRYRQIHRRPPGPGEVELQIHAAALNFKDVLKVLGMLPARALEGTFYGKELGMDAAGVITAVGKEVTKYRVGDAVTCLIRDAFRSHITVPAQKIIAEPKLGEMSFADAASTPMVFCTAYYALTKLARLRKGETVLIHAAAGGVGLAAIQVAQWIGATIIATAGSDEKRDYVRSLGVEHVFNSRTLDFADQVMALTEGRGVDVVLNSLAGEALQRSLSILASFGRFVEMGKRDIVDNTYMPMLPFNRGISFLAFDIDRLIAEQPDLVQSVFDEIWSHFSCGEFFPVPVHVFSAAEIVDAFRHTEQSADIGSIIVSFTDIDGVSVLPHQETQRFKAEASYLITGGFGGFGLEVARWMAKGGAQHLVLVGRSGAKTEQSQEILKHLKTKGVTVKAVAADIGNESEVAALFAEMRQTMPPLRGIMHAAAVLDDALLVNLDETRLECVMAPKARGAWLLHKHTAGLSLDFFVMFSSVSSLVGNPGQGNYVAANAFLDALAQHRRALGLAATSINWGAIGEVGMLANNRATEEHLSRVGIRAIAPKDALNALAAFLGGNQTQVGFVDVDWAKWRQFQSTATDSPKFAHVLSQEAPGQHAAVEHVRAALLAADGKDRPEMLALMIAELVAEAMRMPADRIDIRRPLTEMGIDSLMAVELQIGIRDTFGLEFPVLELVRGESIVALTHELLSRMGIPMDAGDQAGSDERPDSGVATASAESHEPQLSAA